jgi:hypothetical protein
MDIDFVIFWVDGSDVEWQKKKAFYKGTALQNSDVRFRDWGLLRYWFRAVEKYAPWVNRVYFVADNQRPEWLNYNHPKLAYVDQQDFIQSKYLPSFQANTIEDNIHRIPELSEYYVVFNDDMFINSPISPEYYFRDGLPCDGTYEHVFSGRCYDAKDKWGISIMEFCDIHVLNAHFNRKEVTKRNIRGWFGSYLSWKYRINALLITLFGRTEFQHFYTPHNEKAFLKSVCQEAYEAEPEMIASSCTRFRDNVQLNNYYYRYWQLASGMFFPVNVLTERKVVQLRENCLPAVEQLLFDNKIKSLCLNDSSDCTYEDYEVLKPKVVELFERKFPQKSTFEIV